MKEKKRNKNIWFILSHLTNWRQITRNCSYCKDYWEIPNIKFILFLGLLVAVSILFALSTCFIKNGISAPAIKHIGMLILGIITFYYISIMDLRNAKTYTFLILIVSIILLIIMIKYGEASHGAKRWAPIGPIKIQATEFAKIAFIYGLALLIDFTRCFKFHAWNIKKRNGVWFYIISALLVVIFLLILTASASATITFYLIAILMALFGGINPKIFSVFLAILLIGFCIFAYKGISEYAKQNPSEKEITKQYLIEAEALDVALSKSNEQRSNIEKSLVYNFEKSNGLITDKEELKSKDTVETKDINFRIRRIMAWLNPKLYKDAEGRQQYYSLMSITTGGVLGKKLSHGEYKNKIDECQNDFIFAVIAEETGFLGCLIVLVLFIALFTQGFYVIKSCRNYYGKVLAFGALITIIIECLMHIMVNINMMPNTGVCLPFISSGGSAIVMNFWLAAIIVSVSRQRKIKNKDISPDDQIRKKYGKIIKFPEKYNIFKKNIQISYK